MTAHAKREYLKRPSIIVSEAALDKHRSLERRSVMPASIMRLHDRALVREGMVADLMVFDLVSTTSSSEGRSC